jgi:hypothetical protein
MVIVARVSREKADGPRERAAEERRSRREAQKRQRSQRKLRAIRNARRASLLRGRKIGPKRGFKVPKKAGGLGHPKGIPGVSGLGGNAGLALRGGGTILAVAALVAEAIIFGGRQVRRGAGLSERLIDAQDANNMIGDLDEQATANAAALGAIEGNPRLLEIIKQEGKVNATIQRIASVTREDALFRARGADKIARDPNFDSADSLVDKMIKKARAVDLRGLADQAGRAIRENTGRGAIKSTR